MLQYVVKVVTQRFIVCSLTRWPSTTSSTDVAAQSSSQPLLKQGYAIDVQNAEGRVTPRLGF